MGRVYIYVRCTDRGLCPWVASFAVSTCVRGDVGKEGGGEGLGYISFSYSFHGRRDERLNVRDRCNNVTLSKILSVMLLLAITPSNKVRNMDDASPPMTCYPRIHRFQTPSACCPTPHLQGSLQLVDRVQEVGVDSAKFFPLVGLHRVSPRSLRQQTPGQLLSLPGHTVLYGTVRYGTE